NQTDAFLYDSVADTIERVSLNSSGGQIMTDFSLARGMSDDGRFIAFLSGATDVVSGDTNGAEFDLYVHDRCSANGTPVTPCTPSTRLVSIGPAGLQSSDGCFASAQSITDDGRYVTFDCLTDPSTFAPTYPCPTPPFDGDPRCAGV